MHVTPDDGAAFVSFIYPGSIPGHTFAVNEFGIVATVNNLRPKDIPAGLPRMVLGRASLEARSEERPRAGAFHHAFAQAGSTQVVSVEASSAMTCALEVRGVQGHANHMVQDALGQVEQTVTGSSGSRQQRLDALLAGTGDLLDETKALDVLRDEHDVTLPIYRCAPDDPDDENTLATAVFSLTATTVEWRVYTCRDIDRPDVEGVVSVYR